jgi:hypothetical protein
VKGVKQAPWKKTYKLPLLPSVGFLKMVMYQFVREEEDEDCEEECDCEDCEDEE